MSKNIVYEGWLTKSPPTRRIFKTKWRRRWFALRQSGELPGQYFLDYYSDRNRRRLKGTINLDLCEQVDAGLHMTRNSSGSLDPRIRGSVFSIQTQLRTYHLEADCEADMVKWVEAICSCCGLRATSSSPEPRRKGTYQNSSVTVMNDPYELPEGTGPYIPISECITGVRAPDSQRAFSFDPKNIVVGSMSFDIVSDKSHLYLSQPQIRVNNVDLSETESNLSDEECKSLNASQMNVENWTLTRSYVRRVPDAENVAEGRSNTKRNKLRVRSSTGSREKSSSRRSPRRTEVFEGPPVPPRPPKTVTILDPKESFQLEERTKGEREGPKLQEPEIEIDNSPPFPWIRSSSRMSASTSASAVQARTFKPRVDENEECCLTHSLQQYCNLSSLPPIVDRALKPRIANTTVVQIEHVAQDYHNVYGICEGYACAQPQPSTSRKDTVRTSDALQYLDLDLSPKSPTKDGKPRVYHSKSFSAEPRADYKTVDFVKTEAFNITRQDAEASRNVQL
ncbi:uncharacterized protein LOC126978553 isoform X2 [Leptidea sinapis]|uniref:uncharacterized protein LOC126978553 isoform X2 n=1 Tax=Leptidea sinapis TaxID=189913 RepID=UPI0021C4C8A9|nr:uncharacterized protein LOC126978553 isoform X2 [Leptidea sinapis]